MTIDELIAEYKVKPAWAETLVYRLMECYHEMLLDSHLFDRPEYDALREWAISRVEAGEAALWQPGPEVWASVPVWAQWVTGNADGTMYADQYEPDRYSAEWWVNQGKRYKLAVVLPDGVDWRQAKWPRPEATK